MGHANGNGNGHISPEVGELLATAGVDQLFDRAGRYCANEKARIEAKNRPLIKAATTELTHTEKELERLRDELANLPPDGDLRARRRRALVEWALAAVLLVAGFAFTLTALEPFDLGWKGWLYSLGLAIIVPYSIDMVLQQYGNQQRFMRGLALSAALIAILAMISLSLIRSYMFMEHNRAEQPAVVIEGEGVPEEPEVSDFYRKTELFMSVFMMFAALAMEMIAGCAIYAGRRLWAELPANAKELRGGLQAVERQKVEILHRIEALEQEPEHFVNEFWRDFHHSLVKGTERTAVTKIFGFALFALLLLPSVQASAAERVNLVVALDLSASVTDAQGLDRRTEFERNLVGVSRVLQALPAGSRVTVIGITDRSFSQPYVLLAAQLDEKEGYFKERIARGRRDLARAWQKRASGLASDFQRTDLLGALVVSAQLFQARPGWRNVLVLFSDMRHDTKEMNLGKPAVVPVRSALDTVEARQLVADLKGVEVYAVGVGGNGKKVSYWESLRQFWSEYFRKAGASLKAYTILREVPELGQ